MTPEAIVPFSERLRLLRQHARLSLQEVGDAVGISKAHAWELETGKADNPGLKVLIGIARAFRVPLAALVIDLEKAQKP